MTPRPTGWLAAVELSPLDHDPAEVRERAEQLLSRPPYAAESQGPLAALVERVTDLLAEAVQRLLAAVSGSGPLAWAVVTLGLVLLLALVWRATRGTALDPTSREEAGAVPRRTAAAWRAEADAAVAAGRLREAVRCRYGELVATLVERGLLEDVPGRTVGELDSEVRANVPRIAAPVTAAGERFERVVYGGVPAATEDLEVVEAAVVAARDLAVVPVVAR